MAPPTVPLEETREITQVEREDPLVDNEKQAAWQKHNESTADLKKLILQIDRLAHLARMLPEGLALSPPPGQFIISSILQLVALGIAVAFGIYAVKSVRVANEANTFAVQALTEAKLANQIAMLSICASLNEDSDSLPDFCKHIDPIEPYAFSTQATQLFPTPSSSSSIFPATTTSSSAISRSPSTKSSTITVGFVSPTGPLSPSSPATISANPTNISASSPHQGSASLATPTIIGVTVGAVFGFVILIVCLFLLLRRRRRRRSRPQVFSQMPAAPGKIYSAANAYGAPPPGTQFTVSPPLAPGEGVMSGDSVDVGSLRPDDSASQPGPQFAGSTYSGGPPPNVSSLSSSLSLHQIPFGRPGSIPSGGIRRRNAQGSGGWFRQWFLDSRIEGL